MQKCANNSLRRNWVWSMDLHVLLDCNIFFSQFSYYGCPCDFNCIFDGGTVDKNQIRFVEGIVFWDSQMAPDSSSKTCSGGTRGVVHFFCVEIWCMLFCFICLKYLKQRWQDFHKLVIWICVEGTMCIFL